ncbi:nucleoporin p58/p45-like isoform X2 [Epargyreus clarus]|uniref:nucleoporin p58/p45-like isoform X2 n=1 Tax=Epargyreus clarus TaxID=520877 RepID=UPI003C2B8C35
MSFSFGTPSSAPATGLSGGFSFGANKPSTPAFGLGATSQPSTLFGTPATSAPAFGTATPAFGSTSFGATSTAPTFGGGFGSNPPAFGATSTAPAFGATSTAPIFGATTTPAFGATATPAFGAATPAFGAATPAFGATSTAPAFGATSTPAFGATSTPAFGATTTPAFGATTAPTFGSTGLGTGSLSFGATTTTAATGLTFGAPATTTSAGLGGLGGFGFGAPTTTQSTNQWAFGSTSTATTSSSLFAAPSLGLGGVAPTSGATTTSADGKSEPPKQTRLPNEIQTTVDSFKEFVKKQKSISSEIMRASVKPLYKVSREAESTLRAVVALRGETSRARAQSKRLRAAAAAALAAAETAARDPPGLELEITPPPIYVRDLISELEEQLITFRRQMDVSDKQMQSSPKLLTEQELTLGIRRMHESLVALAGRLQGVHAQVQAQKEQYLNLRKYVLKDPTNVFDEPTSNTSLDQILRDAEGTRKKPKNSNISDIGMGTTNLSGNLQHLAGPTPFTYLGSLSPYPANDATGSNWQPQSTAANTSLNISGFGSTAPSENNSFQLQKPPGKRGKQ